MNLHFKLLKKYSTSEKNFEMVLDHSFVVFKKSIDIIIQKKLYDKIDFNLIMSGCFFHDIGVFKFMKSFNKKQDDYIMHGIIGGKILRAEGFEKEALIAERHIGSGLSKKYIIKMKFPLPQRDFIPISLEEKIICYADKFHSKSGKKDDLESIEKEMKNYGRESFERFLKLKDMFE